jgi:hypothetical protein
MSTLDRITPKYVYKRERINPAFPIFSDEDAVLRDLKWYFVRGYAARSYRYRDENGDRKRKIPYAHRVVMERVMGRELAVTEFIDHLNRNKLDCRRENLCIVSKQQNCQNTGPRSNNTSGYRGVTWCSTVKRWRAVVKTKDKAHCGGRYDTPEEANMAAIALRKRLGFHGSQFESSP